MSTKLQTVDKSTFAQFAIAILGSLQDASSSVFQQSGNGRGGSYSKPGWADYVSDLYKDSRDMGKCGAMLGSLVKAKYLSFIVNRSQDVNMRFVTSNVMKTPCVKNSCQETIPYRILERGETYECEQYSASHMH